MQKRKKVGRAQRAQRAAQLAVAAAFKFKLCMQANETCWNCNAQRLYALHGGGAIRSIILKNKNKKVGRAQRAQRAAQLAVAAAFRFKLCMQASETGRNCYAQRL